MDKRLYRARHNTGVAGVCSGFSDYLGVDVSIIRLIIVLLTMTSSGMVIVGYLIAVMIMPVQPRTTWAIDSTEAQDKRQNRKAIGFMLMTIGIYLILKRHIAWLDFDLVWPVALIGLGLYFLKQKRGI